MALSMEKGGQNKSEMQESASGSGELAQTATFGR